MPIVPLYLVRQNLFRDRRKPGFIRYGVREAVHAARDRFTPRYAHRHSDDEVSDWFREAGYTQLERVSEQERESFIPPAYVVGVGVQGVRTAAVAELAKRRLVPSQLSDGITGRSVPPVRVSMALVRISWRPPAPL